MSTNHLDAFEQDIRRHTTKEGREPVSEEYITLLKIRQLVAGYQLASIEREAELDELRDEDGEPLDGDYAKLDEYRYDAALADSDALAGLIRELTELLP